MEFNLFKTLDALINGWCERRALRPLAYLLPAYPGVFAHTDQALVVPVEHKVGVATGAAG